MKSQARRLLVGRLYHESHGFSGDVTPRSWFTELRDQEVITTASQSNATLGGIVSRARKLGYELVGSFDISAPPSSLVDDEFYAAIKAEFLKRAKLARCDAIALDMHGAMGTTAIPDAEGDFLRAVRDAVGNGIPIGVGLDLHAHITPQMLSAADIIIACKENPHSDTFQCGEQVVQLLTEVLEHRLKPATTLVKVPMLLIGNNETGSGPLRDIHNLARDFSNQHPEIHDISIYNVFRFTDDFDMGQAITVITDGPHSSATLIAEKLGREFWNRRTEFQEEFPSIEDALALASNPDKSLPIAIGDMGDRVLAGAPGDSVAILQAALAFQGLRGAIPITDAQAVVAARAAGIGAVVTLSIGGSKTPSFQPITVNAKVVSLSNGVFTMRGPWQGGTSSDMGNSAVLDLKNGILLLVTTRPAYSVDPQAFESQGIKVSDLDFLVSKSGHHFKLNFAGLATPIVVASPGISHPFPGFHPGTRGRFYPEHQIPQPVTSSSVFQLQTGTH